MVLVPELAMELATELGMVLATVLGMVLAMELALEEAVEAKWSYLCPQAHLCLPKAAHPFRFLLHRSHRHNHRPNPPQCAAAPKRLPWRCQWPSCLQATAFEPLCERERENTQRWV